MTTRPTIAQKKRPRPEIVATVPSDGVALHREGRVKPKRWPMTPAIAAADSTPDDDQALVERRHDVAAGAQADEKGADHRGDDADGADRRAAAASSCRRSDVGEIDGGEQHRRDDRDGVGLEQVGRHAGAVADIVADIVGDDGGIARIVLGNAGLDLADEVGADIGALGEDAAARDARRSRSARRRRRAPPAPRGWLADCPAASDASRKK